MLMSEILSAIHHTFQVIYPCLLVVIIYLIMYLSLVDVKMNVKPANAKKSNHVNLYLTDSDKRIVDIVLNEHPDMALGTLLVYSLKRLYGQSMESDYNAQLVKTLHDWKGQLNADIESLTDDIKKKREQICNIDILLSEIIKGESNE